MMRAEPDETNHEEPEGVVCPRCFCRHCPVLYTRRGRRRRIRRRQCRYCGHRFSTKEEIQ